MRKHSVLTALLIAGAFAVQPARAADWDTTDKVMFGSFVALQAVDALQTNQVAKHPDQFKEVNPLYGNPPNMGLVIGVKALFIGGVYWLTSDMKSSDRKLLLGVVDLISVGVVANNISVGVKIGF